MIRMFRRKYFGEWSLIRDSNLEYVRKASDEVKKSSKTKMN